MLVRDVGEARLIELLSEVVDVEATDQPDAHRFPLRLGIGDDAAAWQGPATTMVATADALVEGVHFHLDRIDWPDLGWKALAVNLSDVAAMGCMPLYSTVTLGLRGDLPVDGIEAMYRGMAEISREFGGRVVGGDVVRSATMFIGVAMYGAAMPRKGNGDTPNEPLLTRNAAAAGDVIAVTGSLGCSAGGLYSLATKLAKRPGNEATVHLVEAHNRPVPRVSAGIQLARRGVKTAIDISDGLVADLGKLCKASGVSAVVDANDLPVDDHLRQAFPDRWLPLALAGGEDYELLFTAAPALMAELHQALDVRTTTIGEVAEGPPQVTVLDENGAPIDVEHLRWDHFADDA